MTTEKMSAPSVSNSSSGLGSTKNREPKKEARAYKPRLAVQANVPTTKVSFSIKKTAAVLICDYARFLSELQGEELTEDAVLEALAFELQKDRGFAKWLTAETAKSRATPAVSKSQAQTTSASNSTSSGAL